jgi:hypothetical protein
VITNRAGSVSVINQGWFIFGGFKNPLVNAQKLPTPNDTWSLGPYLYKNETVSGQCLVQVIFQLTILLSLTKFCLS